MRDFGLVFCEYFGLLRFLGFRYFESCEFFVRLGSLGCGMGCSPALSVLCWGYLWGLGFLVRWGGSVEGFVRSLQVWEVTISWLVSCEFYEGLMFGWELWVLFGSPFVTCDF